MTDALADALDAETPEVIALRASNRQLQLQLRAAKAGKADLVAAVYAAAMDAAVTIGHPPKTPTARKVTTKGDPHVALVHTTDWQGGKKTADYDLDVLERRLGHMMDKVDVLAQRHGHPVTEAVVLFGGDDIEGVSIFPTQPFEVHAGLYEQVFAVVRLKRMVIDRALSMFDRVTVYRKWGNHGRIGKFGELPDTDNLDLIADRFAAEAYRDNPRVTWHYQSLDYVQRFQIGNYGAVLLHGNEFYRSFSSQRIVNKLTSWQTVLQPSFRDCYMGHFHRSDVYGLPNGGKVYMTGSPESSNSYAADMLAVASTPSQRLHFIDPVAGRVQAEHILSLE